MALTGVTIKGIKDSLLITLGEGELTKFLAELGELLEEKASFFAGGKVALEVGPRALSVGEVGKIKRLLAQNKVSLQAVMSESARTQAAARSLGLATFLRPKAQMAEKISQGVLIHCTLHSGQVVQNSGHVVIVGDVNPGAEVIAGGDIVVWGRLGGTVHAGAMGDEEAMVCALQMSPTQLRIASHIARPPERQRSGPIEPEVASVQNGGIVVEPWRQR
ncbi:MAG: septum site-determining protein MinC [Chloroflexota bacterium]|nr:septum site-determining protein MinC [Chloroflexota bacterium]